MYSQKRPHLTLHVFDEDQAEAKPERPEILSLGDAESGETGVLLLPMLWEMRCDIQKTRAGYFHLDIDRRGGAWIDRRVQLMEDSPRGERAIPARVEGNTVIVAMRREDLIGPGDIRGMKAPAQFRRDGWFRIRFMN